MQLTTTLSNQANFFELIIDALPCAVFVLNEQEQIVTMNKACKPLFEFETPSHIQTSIVDYVHPTSQSAVKQLLKQVFSGTPSIVSLPLSVSLAQQGINTTIHSAKRIYYQEQPYLLISLSLNQLSQEILSEIETERTIRSAISDATLDTLITINMDDTIVDFNDAGFEMFGWRKSEVLGKKMDEIFVPEKYRESHRKGLEHYRKTREGPLLGQRVIIEALHKNGHSIPVELSLVPIDLNGGHHVTAFVRDISELKESEKRLTEEKEKAIDASAAKSRFLSHMSHEIRSPLNALLGGVSLLGETLQDEKQTYFYQLVKSSGDSLVAIINEILDFSKIESGHVTINREMTQLQTILDESLQAAIIKCPPETYLFGCIENAMPPIVHIDTNKVRQIIIVFLDNAFKFTQRGLVKLSLSYQSNIDSENTDGELVIKVKDTGVGIPKEEQDLIFLEFEQVDAVRDSGFGGTGLGLTIANRLVGLMGGTISIESNANFGTCFTISIPCKGIENAAPPLIDITPQNALLVSNDQFLPMIAIDSFSNCYRDIIKLHQCSSNDDIEQIVLTRHIDIVFVSLSIYQTHDLISKVPASTRVVVLSTQHVSKCEFTDPRADFIHAPLTSTKLVEKIISNAQPQHTLATKNETPLYAKKSQTAHILLVEDMLANRLVAKAMLVSSGFQVSEAVDGIEALAMLERHKFDLVLMDMRMPRLNGLDASIEIRKSKSSYKDIPIIALTANAEASERERCLSIGINSFVSKPFDLGMLLNEIEKYI